MLKPKIKPSNVASIHSSLTEDVIPLLEEIGYENPNINFFQTSDEEIATHYKKSLKFSIIDKGAKKSKGNKNAKT